VSTFYFYELSSCERIVFLRFLKRLSVSIEVVLSPVFATHTMHDQKLCKEESSEEGAQESTALGALLVGLLCEGFLKEVNGKEVVEQSR